MAQLIEAAVGTNTYVPSPSDTAGLSGTRIVQARRGAIIMDQGRSPKKCHATPPPAVPARHVRTYNLTLDESTRIAENVSPAGPLQSRHAPAAFARRRDAKAPYYGTAM